MSKLKTIPKSAQHGSFLHQTSVAGQKVTFVQQSGTANGSISVGAGGIVYLNITLSVYRDPDTEQQLIGYDDCIAWNYLDILIDNDNDYNYIYANGGSLSSGQQKIAIGSLSTLAPVDGSSQNTVYSVTNGDSAPHTIYLYSFWKYIVTG